MSDVLYLGNFESRAVFMTNTPKNHAVIVLFVYNMRLKSSNSGNLSTVLFEKQNTTATVAMEIKYLHVSISN